MRGALHRWKRELERRATFEIVDIYNSRALLSKVCDLVKHTSLVTNKVHASEMLSH